MRARTSVDDTGAVGASIKKILGCVALGYGSFSRATRMRFDNDGSRAGSVVTVVYEGDSDDIVDPRAFIALEDEDDVDEEGGHGEAGLEEGAGGSR